MVDEAVSAITQLAADVVTVGGASLTVVTTVALLGLVFMVVKKR